MNTTNNRVQLVGNLGKDPEIKNLEKGGKLARFSIATRDRYRTRSGEQAEDTQWHNVSCWGKVAEHVEAEFKKGSFVQVEGRLTSRTYTDKNGQKRYFTEVVAVEVTSKHKAEAA